jgi:hypothetical protein
MDDAIRAVGVHPEQTRGERVGIVRAAAGQAAAQPGCRASSVLVLGSRRLASSRFPPLFLVSACAVGAYPMSRCTRTLLSAMWPSVRVTMPTMTQKWLAGGTHYAACGVKVTEQTEDGGDDGSPPSSVCSRSPQRPL